ncbi:MAG: DUF362 domain-containing protein [Candidatus Aminicenantes bacterium]|nr:MAG: DUF362 domain-containing protein [Candidatus Aminicenantes bacterium]
MKKIERREFIKNMSIATVGTAIYPVFPNLSREKAIEPAPKSRVAIVRDPKAATNKGQTINPDIVHKMMNTGIKSLTGQKNVADAYASLFPKHEKNDIIAIKVNCMQTHPLAESCRKIIDSIVNGLKSAGVAENNIILYDWRTEDLTSCGYTHNTDSRGVRCFGNDEKGWGYEEAAVTPGGASVHLSKILTRCTHLVNIPVLRDHHTVGVSLSLKNHYGSVDSPVSLHGPNFKCEPHLAELNTLDPIRKKTRLIVLPALVGVYQGHHSPPQFEYNGLIASQDPVAVDYHGYKMIDEQRIKHDLRPLAKTGRYPTYIETSAKLGLGTNDPNKMDIISIGV